MHYNSPSSDIQSWIFWLRNDQDIYNSDPADYKIFIRIISKPNYKEFVVCFFRTDNETTCEVTSLIFLKENNLTAPCSLTGTHLGGQI